MSMGVGGVGTNYYSQISTGSRFPRAADGASETAIIQQMEGQRRGYDVGERNAQDGISALNVADGALSGIHDQLLQIRDLAVQASNTATVTDSDRLAIQDQINQLMQGISETASNTQFNTRNLLDGSNTNMQIVSGANGQGQQISTGDATLQALGIANFDITSGNFNIQTIDDAIQRVSDQQSNIGAQTNSLSYSMNYSSQASYNLNNSISTMSDTDIGKAATNLNKQKLLQNINFIMQKKKQDEEKKKTNLLM